MKKYILLLSLLLASCTATNEPVFSGLVDTTPRPTQAQQIPTATIIPTATLNTQATIEALQQDAAIAQAQARDAQLTSDAASRLLVDATMTHEAIQLTYLQATQEKEQVELQYAALTMESNRATGTAYTTAVPKTQTQQAKNDRAIGTVLALTVNAPAQLQAMNEAEIQERWGWAYPASTMLLSVTLFVTMAGLIVYVLRRPIAQAQEQEQPFITPSDLTPIPMMPVTSNPQYTARSEFNCTPEQLVELARGYVEHNIPLGFRRWIGSPVFTALKDIREKLKELELAYELPLMAGQMEYTEAGKAFMRYTAEHGHPPDGYTCVLKSPPPSLDQT